MSEFCKYLVMSISLHYLCINGLKTYLLILQVSVTPALYSEAQEKKILLKLTQPPIFKGEGKDVEKDAEVWIEAMDDYFSNAGTTPANQSMLARFRLQGDAKLWWKQHCRDNAVEEDSQSWGQIKEAVKARYLPPAHQVLKMNEFFELRQLSLTLEEYYSKFVTLRRYAPQMTYEQQVARFCQGLNSPLNSRLEAMRPVSLQDALLRAKPLVKEIQRSRPPRYQGAGNGRGRFEPHQPRPNQTQNSQPIPRVYAAQTAKVREFLNVRCYGCNEMGHYKNKCSRLSNSAIYAA